MNPECCGRLSGTPDATGIDKGVERKKNGDRSEVLYNRRGWTAKKQHVIYAWSNADIMILQGEPESV